MNLPNKLTLARILLVPVFMVFVSLTQYGTAGYQPGLYLAAGVVFALASFTDYLDGHLARKWHMITDFGKFADPLADKVLTTVAFLYMMRDGVCSPVVLTIILTREFAVSGLRMVGGRRQGRQGHRGQYVGQGQDGAADAEHHLLLLCRGAGRPHRPAGRGADRQRPVLAGGRRHRHLGHQVPGGQPALHQHRKVRGDVHAHEPPAKGPAILANLAVVWMELKAIPLSWSGVHEQMFLFYTELSNLFAMGVCLAVALCQLRALLAGGEMPAWARTPQVYGHLLPDADVPDGGVRAGPHVRPRRPLRHAADQLDAVQTISSTR